MLEKKLLTLACAGGILACGACFLPPMPERKPPPPPVRLDLQGIRRIRVDVKNQSPPNHLVPLQLAARVASEIIFQGRRLNVTAYPDSVSDDEDGVLQVIVLSETGTPGKKLSNWNGIEWSFDIGISAVLTKKNGQVVWRELDGGYRFSNNFAQEDEVDLWKEPPVLDRLTGDVGTRLVTRMLNAR
jgi:hypothetical protein